MITIRKRWNFLTLLVKEAGNNLAYIALKTTKKAGSKHALQKPQKSGARQRVIEMTNVQVQRGEGEAALRVEPGQFPQKFSYVARGAETRIGVKLDARGAVVRRNLPSSNLPFSIALPGRAFKGVAARAIAHADGRITVTLELHHADPELCIPLLIAHNLSDIVADWQNWAAMYDIPMLMVEADGVARPVDARMHQSVAANDDATGPRRRAKTRSAPRLTVRLAEEGKLGIQLRVAGRAIAA